MIWGWRPRNLPVGHVVSKAVLPRQGIPMRVVPWSMGPGPIGIPPTSVVICHGAWKSSPHAVQAISWRRRSGSAHGIDSCMAKGKHAHQVVVAMARALRAFMWAMAKQVTVPPTASRRLSWYSNSGPAFQRPSAEAQPRCGVTLGSVKRPLGPAWLQLVSNQPAQDGKPASILAGKDASQDLDLLQVACRSR